MRVDSPLSLDEARRALMADMPERGAVLDYGQRAMHGAVEGDSFTMFCDGPDFAESTRGVVRGRLRERGENVRVLALLRVEDTRSDWRPSDWRVWVALASWAFGFVELLLFGFRSWRDSPGLLLLAAGSLIALSRLSDLPNPPPASFVGHVKEFLSHALLAEPLEVGGARRG